MAAIPYGRQSISQADIDAVVEVLQSDYLTQGPAVPRFESAVLAATRGRYAFAMNSATSALHAACLALGLGAGDRLWTTPISFVASANCALYCGAQVDFVDIDPQTYNLCPDALEAKLQRAKSEGQIPKIVVAVHLCGQPCDMRRLHELARHYGFALVEDASHAIGGSYRGEPIGSGIHSDVTVFSFHPVKIITTAEGGMAVTNDPAIAQRLALIRSHGITRDPALMSQTPDGPWYYEQVELGYNYRMTDVQAALGSSQVSRLKDFVARRHALAKRYDDLLADLPLTLPWQCADSRSGLHLYVVRLQLARTERSHREIFEALRAAGILVNLHYIPIYRQPYYKAFGYDPADYPEAEAYYREAISIPMFQTLTHEQQDRVAIAFREILT